MKDDTFIYHDEDDYFDTKKESRKIRKLAKKKDRSKYKKTDSDKQKQAIVLPDLPLKRGIVTTIRPQQFFVLNDEKTIICSLRGALKKENQKQKNLVIVGDFVGFEDLGDGTGVIHTIDERKSVLSRASHLSQQKEHLIAANVDIVLITVSVVDPPLRAPIIDRYIIAATKGNLTPVIICNKIDLLDDPEYDEGKREEERQALYEYENIYNAIGYPFISVSAKTEIGMDAVRAIMKDKICVFSGQSGAGKSSIINATVGLDLKVRKTVSRTKKGAHTTSHAQLFMLDFGGACLDTPGIKSFGVWDLLQQDLRSYFVEIAEEGLSCKFPNCSHRGEPGCAIPQAIEEKKISLFRYNSYLALLDELQQEHLRR